VPIPKSGLRSSGGVLRESIEHSCQENRLLSALSEKDRVRLIPRLDILTLFAKETMHESGEEMNYVYVPLDCIVVLISSVDEKATVEVGLIGNEGMTGTPILMGGKQAINQALILVEGKALRLPAAVLRKQAKRSTRMREVMLNYANGLLAQGPQLAACHRYHTPTERLARLLLIDPGSIEDSGVACNAGSSRATAGNATRDGHSSRESFAGAGLNRIRSVSNQISRSQRHRERIVQLLQDPDEPTVDG